MTQYGVWVTNKNVPFQRHRYATSTEMQEGVVDAGDYKVIQRAAGANMSVDVGIGKAWIQIDTGARNGLAFAFSDAVDNPAIGASHATLPRIDQVVLQYNDTSLAAGVGGDIPTVRVIAGVATSGATLDNRNGAAALPNDCVRLADVLVPAASTSVVTANIRDRRPWARGARKVMRRAPGAGDLTKVGGPASAADATNLSKRLECSGSPVKVTLHAQYSQTSGGAVWFYPYMDGAVMPDISAQGWRLVPSGAATTGPAAGVALESPVAAGSHLFELYWETVAAQTATLKAAAGFTIMFVIQEDVRQDADNT